MAFLRRAQPLPIGLDIAASAVSIVVAELAREGFVVRHAATAPVVPPEGEPLDRALADAIRSLVEAIGSRERRCVLAVPQHDVVTRLFRLPPRMSRTEAERAATIEADGIVPWPTSERLVALDAIPGYTRDMLLSIGRTSSIERSVAIARAAGLRPVAVDVPLCAWRRAAPDTDAVIDCSSERVALTIFGTPLGSTHVFAPRLIEDRLLAQIRSAFVDARRDGLADVQTIALLGEPQRLATLAEALGADGYRIARLDLGGETSPTWAFAYGLATWSIAPRGLRVA
jgi:hypothetical protein